MKGFFSGTKNVRKQKKEGFWRIFRFGSKTRMNRLQSKSNRLAFVGVVAAACALFAMVVVGLRLLATGGDTGPQKTNAEVRVALKDESTPEITTMPADPPDVRTTAPVEPPGDPRVISPDVQSSDKTSVAEPLTEKNIPEDDNTHKMTELESKIGTLGDKLNRFVGTEQMARDLEPPGSKEATGEETKTPIAPPPDKSAPKAGANPTELPADLSNDRPETKRAGVDKPENLKEKLKSTGPIAAREKTEAVYHKVSAGETLYRIHRMYLEKYGVTVADLRRLNDLSREDPIHPGQRLLIHK